MMARFGTKALLTVLMAGISTFGPDLLKSLGFNDWFGPVVQPPAQSMAIGEIVDSITTTGADEAYDLLFDCLNMLKDGGQRSIDENGRHRLCARTYYRVSRVGQSALARMRAFNAGIEDLIRTEEQEILRLRTLIDDCRRCAAGNGNDVPQLEVELDRSFAREAQLVELAGLMRRLIHQFSQSVQLTLIGGNQDVDYTRRLRLDRQLKAVRSVQPPPGIEGPAWDLLNQQRSTERNIVDILQDLGEYPPGSRRLQSAGQPNWIENLALIIQVEIMRKTAVTPAG